MKEDEDGQEFESRPSHHGGRRSSAAAVSHHNSKQRAGTGLRSGGGGGLIPDRMAALEKLLCDLILTQGEREKVLLNQIASLRSELGRRSLAFQQTLAYYQKRLQQLNTRKQDEIHSAHSGDSDSGVGEEQFTLHLSVILEKQNGSLGFNVSPCNGTSTPQVAKDLVVSRIAPDGPAKGKLFLQDKVIKVNGVDFTGFTHDAAVNFLKNAQEPVVVEALRQLSMPCPRLAECSSQTDDSVDSASLLPNMQMKEKTAAVKMPLEKTDEVLEEELLKYEIEYEEVTLSKLKTDAKLGLALCCAEENESDIFIENVDPESVAGRDGRIRSGDQIIQVNGIDVHTRSQAVELFASEKSVVSVVVARPHLKMSVLEEEEEEDVDVEDACGQLLQGEKEDYDVEDEDDGTACAEKDSGVGKTDESTKTEEESTSEQDSVLDAGKLIVDTQDYQSSCATPAQVLGSLENISSQRQTSKPNLGSTLDKSEAVGLWVESTAVGNGPLQRSVDEDLCLSLFLPPPPPSDKDSDALSIYSCSCCTMCRQSSSLEPPSGSPATVYTDRQNLARTIQLQQQLFRRALMATSSPTRSPPPPPPPPALEWKVKRRSDGTRYIVRRPVRNRLLKERANRLAEERGGVTTDDDAASELKIGRYWSKEERKRHLERAKERHRRKEELLRSQPTASCPKSSDILELSRRKMMRMKGRTLFDDFTTVQEVLAHGSRSKGGMKAPHQLLSVTTV